MSVDCIREWLTDICLVGAAALTSLLAATVCGRWLLRGAAAVRPYLLAFLVFAAVAMNFAQKSGTNGLMRTTESAEAAVALRGI